MYCWWQKYVASKSRSSDKPIPPEEDDEEGEGEEDAAEDEEEDEDDPSSWTTEEESDYLEGPSESPEASGESALLEASGEQQDVRFSLSLSRFIFGGRGMCHIANVMPDLWGRESSDPGVWNFFSVSVDEWR